MLWGLRCVIFKCITCTRHKSLHPIPRMGILSEARVHSIGVFSSVGTDYGRPHLIRNVNGETRRPLKFTSHCLFVWQLKAIHVEIVSDLTSDAFLAGSDRFVTRGGIQAYAYSDYGTNYVGSVGQLNIYFATRMSKLKYSHASVVTGILSHRPRRILAVSGRRVLKVWNST